jgi:hypothetical protein
LKFVSYRTLHGNDATFNCGCQVLTNHSVVDTELNAADVCNGVVDYISNNCDGDCSATILNHANYPETSAGTTNQAGTCDDPGWTSGGSPLADCYLGTWKNLQGSPCVENECPVLSKFQNASFPATKQSLTTATGTCITGYASATTFERACDVNGDWQGLTGDPCLPKQCSPDKGWNLTSEGEMVERACIEFHNIGNYTGSVT